jgi:hypothetical protein
MSSLNGFSVNVPQAQEETSDGYIVLKHGQNFSLRLHNGHKYCGGNKPADAEVWIQGKLIGTFRVPANQTIEIEHPVSDSGKFTAYKNGSSEARQIGIDPDSNENGLIEVIWKPGSQKVNQVQVTWDSWGSWSPPSYHNHKIAEFDNYYDDGHYYKTTTSDRSCNLNTTIEIGHVEPYCCSMALGSGSNDLVGGGVGLSGHSHQAFSEIEQLDYDEPETTIFLRIAFRDNVPRPITNTSVYKVQSTNVPRRLR